MSFQLVLNMFLSVDDIPQVDRRRTVLLLLKPPISHLYHLDESNAVVFLGDKQSSHSSLTHLKFNPVFAIQRKAILHPQN